MHDTILAFKSARYGWWALALCLVSVAIYLSQTGVQVANGGTWQGYVLGGFGALLIVWLTALGIRKRRYHSNLGSVQGWTSAHVYLGSALLLIASLHCAFQFGWNVHSLAYGLMSLVIFSGFFGLYAYSRFPSLVSKNRAGRSDQDLFTELHTLNQQGIEISQQCDAQVQQVIESCVARTSLGGGILAQLRARDSSTCLLPSVPQEATSPVQITPNSDQAAVIAFIANAIPHARKRHQTAQLQRLLAIVCRRQTLLRQLRRDIQLKAGLQIWLRVHIPLSIGLLVALGIHIVAVFFFW